MTKKTKGTTRASAADTFVEQAEPQAGGTMVAAASCGCGAHDPVDGDGRKAIAVDGAIKERNIKRLRRIEGQVRGLQKMVEDDRYCGDIMIQVSSVHEALRSVSRELMRNDLKHCASSAIRSSDGEAEVMYDELVDLMFKHSR